jgi:hypothetical protein
VNSFLRRGFVRPCLATRQVTTPCNAALPHGPLDPLSRMNYWTLSLVNNGPGPFGDLRFAPVGSALARYVTSLKNAEKKKRRRAMERRVGVFLLLLLFLGASGASLDGQGSEAQRPSRLRASVLGSVGSGPSPTGEYGAKLSLQVLASVLVFSEVSAVRTGILGGCAQSWPESYSCSVEGTSLLGGIEVEPVSAKLHPFLEVGGGTFRRKDGVVDGASSRSWYAGVGVRAGEGGVTSWRLSWRRLWVKDGAYEALLGEALSFSTVRLELEVHPGDP